MCMLEYRDAETTDGNPGWSAYIKQRRTSSSLSTPSLSSAKSECCTANSENASRISASCSAVMPFSFASFEGRFRDGRFAGAALRRLAGYVQAVS